MLRYSVAWLATVTHASLKYAANELNALLDLSGGRRPVPRDELRGFLTRTVVPILEGTSLDRRDNTSEMRRWLGQLVRDASFSAHVVKARPTGRFVQAVTTCIKEDAARMNFIQKMSSAQASKTVEHLCSIGVRDTAVYAMLLPRIDFTNLRDVARVMFAFTEAGLGVYNTNLLVPLYCGEAFSLVVTYPHGAPRKDDNAYCNLLDAIRVLRALSKSVRLSVEVSRRGGDAGAGVTIPFGSINQLRNALVLFILDHADESVLRGAHWSNFARAMIHFPPELDKLVGLAESGGAPLTQQRQLVRTVERLLTGEQDSTAPWNTQSGESSLARTPVRCAELARYGIMRVFDNAEGRQKRKKDWTDTARQSPQSSSGTSAGTDRPFDLSTPDMIKLVRVVQEVYPAASPLRHPRVSRLLGAVVDRLGEINFRSLLQLLQAMRAMRGDALSQDTVQSVVDEVARRLRDPDSAADIPFPAFIEFCSLLAVFRIHHCQEAVNYICEHISTFPKALDGHAALSLLKALTVTRDGSLATRREVGLDVAERMTFHYHRSGPLLVMEPILCDKMWASLVLLDAVPTTVILERCCGGPDSATLACNSQLRAAGSVVMFDISRSLFHFGKEASASAPEHLPELWHGGIVRSLLPLLEQFGAFQLDEVRQGRSSERALSAGYVPIAWRSTMEAVSLYLDKASAEESVRMLTQIMPRLKAIGVTAADWALSQMDRLSGDQNRGTGGSGPEQMQACRAAFAQVSFSANAVIHVLSYLLMLENCVYRAEWKCRGKESAIAHAQLLKKEYLDFLGAPVRGGAITVSVMDVVKRVFDMQGTANPSDDPTAAMSLLQKNHALEITTNLPFAISLVLEAGPVNEYFTERTVPLMMASMAEDDLA